MAGDGSGVACWVLGVFGMDAGGELVGGAGVVASVTSLVAMLGAALGPAVGFAFWAGGSGRGPWVGCSPCSRLEFRAFPSKGALGTVVFGGVILAPAWIDMPVITVKIFSPKRRGPVANQIAPTNFSGSCRIKYIFTDQSNFHLLAPAELPRIHTQDSFWVCGCVCQPGGVIWLVDVVGAANGPRFPAVITRRYGRRGGYGHVSKRPYSRPLRPIVAGTWVVFANTDGDWPPVCWFELGFPCSGCCLASRH